MGERAFELDETRRRLFCRIGEGSIAVRNAQVGDSELDVEFIRSDATGAILGRSRAVLQKQSEEVVNR